MTEAESCWQQQQSVRGTAVAQWSHLTDDDHLVWCDYRSLGWWEGVDHTSIGSHAPNSVWNSYNILSIHTQWTQREQQLSRVVATGIQLQTQVLLANMTACHFLPTSTLDRFFHLQKVWIIIIIITCIQFPWQYHLHHEQSHSTSASEELAGDSS